MHIPRFSSNPALAAMLCSALALGAQPAHATDAATAPQAQRKDSRCSTAIEERNLATFQSYLAALRSGDQNATHSFWASSAIIVAYGSVPFAGTFAVNDGTWGSLQQQYWDFGNMGVSEEDPVLYADCDKVILNGPFKRTARATGRSVDIRVIEYFTFNKEGKMTRDDFYLSDTAAVRSALGLQ
jgi:ketosteroid isomerase-like protein